MSHYEVEPIEDLIDRSSLGSRSVRILARRTPADLVDRIVNGVPTTSEDFPRDFSDDGTYSSVGVSYSDTYQKGDYVPEEEKSDYEIAVNGSTHSLESEKIDFDRIVNFAYPGEVDDERYIFKVEYENAESQPHDGTLVKGQHVDVRHSGTEFSVLRSVRS